MTSPSGWDLEQLSAVARGEPYTSDLEQLTAYWHVTSFHITKPGGEVWAGWNVCTGGIYTGAVLFTVPDEASALQIVADHNGAAHMIGDLRRVFSGAVDA